MKNILENENDDPLHLRLIKTTTMPEGPATPEGADSCVNL